jgi:hypothetical protein
MGHAHLKLAPLQLRAPQTFDGCRGRLRAAHRDETVAACPTVLSDREVNAQDWTDVVRFKQLLQLFLGTVVRKIAHVERAVAAAPTAFRRAATRLATPGRLRLERAHGQLRTTVHGPIQSLASRCGLIRSAERHEPEAARTSGGSVARHADVDDRAPETLEYLSQCVFRHGV